MKKTFSLLLALLVSSAIAQSAFAAQQGDPVEPGIDYPGSVEVYDWDAAENAELMLGTFYRIGSVFGSPYTELEIIDGDYTTYYAPVNDDFTPVNQFILKTDTPYTVSEIRFFGRDGKFDRTIGYCFDASNDGENWTTLYVTTEAQSEEEYDYVAIKSSDFEYNGGFTYFRVHQIDTTIPFNLSEVEWWGVKSDAAVDAPVNEDADGYDTGAEKPIKAEPVYPSSGYDGNLINGTVIGNETGWGDNAAAGAAAAFDGDANTFFDPLGVGDGFCGIDAGETYILDAVAVRPRNSSEGPSRYLGAMIQGSNDGENWTTLYTASEAAASSDEYVIITALENNTGFSMYRYFNETSHGDVAEVEFYGTPVAAPAETEASVAETEEVVAETVAETETETEIETEAETTTETAPKTFDMGIIAAAAAVVSLAGYAIAKKH